MIVCADNAGVAPLIANRTAIGLWETFKLVNGKNGTVSLQALVNGLYVTAADAGASPLVASSKTIGSEQRFDLVVD